MFIEIVFPIEEPALRDRIVNQILATQLADNVKASILGNDGTYSRPAVKKESSQRSSQGEFMALALGSQNPQPRERSRKTTHKIEVAKAPR